MPGGQAKARVLLFTDTLGDVNGVSRFVNDLIDRSAQAGRDLSVFTSTRMPVRSSAAILNFRPRFATAMPGYRHLEVACPPAREMLRTARALAPTCIHVSTPGPVGLVGRKAAKILGVPLVGVYHTDFPAYIEHLFNDAALSWLCRSAMGRFYGAFDRVLTRSSHYTSELRGLGIDPARCRTLTAGIRTERFSPRFKDPEVWRPFGLPAQAVKVLYAGRVSVEKNLPMLAKVWRTCLPLLQRRGIDARLVVLGDGPYREEMEEQLQGSSAAFLGFQTGRTLSSLYASSDLFVFPSVTDTLGQAVLEAQCSGLPALVSDVGGPRDIVHHGQTGFVASIARPDVWRDRLIALCMDASLRSDMSRAAAATAADRTFERSFAHFWQEHEAISGFPGSDGPEIPAADRISTPSPGVCTVPA
ncbi:MAG: glycosyltransferase family 1 protein [Phycisphaerales bacterium]|nr:glycosyltransferase family 1 protein [Planctomycetota bacterium]